MEQSDNQSAHKTEHWFIKKQGKVTGPFPVKLIGSYLILGRIDLDTLVSPDEHKWIPIGRLPSLIPDEVKHATTAEGKASLHKAKLREDERRGESRRDDGPNRRVSERNDDDRRQKDDRRQNEEEISAAYLKLKSDFSQHSIVAKRRVLYGLVVVFAAVVALIAGFIFTEPATKITKTDCSVVAGPGIDWQSCNKNSAELVAKNLSKAHLHSTKFNSALLVRANLTGANLSYAGFENANLSEADLSSAVMKGASLNNANLSGAKLIGADLSYADLSQAILLNVQVLNTRFDHAIWSDGRRCAAGSVDQCIFTP